MEPVDDPARGQRGAELLEGLRAELVALDPTSELFTPAMCQVDGEVASVFVKTAWHGLTRHERLEIIHSVTLVWSRVSDRDGAAWFLYDTGGTALGGRSVWSGDYLEE